MRGDSQVRPALQRRRESGQEEDGTLHTVVERYDGVPAGPIRADGQRVGEQARRGRESHIVPHISGRES